MQGKHISVLRLKHIMLSPTKQEILLKKVRQVTNNDDFNKDDNIEGKIIKQPESQEIIRVTSAKKSNKLFTVTLSQLLLEIKLNITQMINRSKRLLKTEKPAFRSLTRPRIQVNDWRNDWLMQKSREETSDGSVYRFQTQSLSIMCKPLTSRSSKSCTKQDGEKALEHFRRLLPITITCPQLL